MIGNKLAHYRIKEKIGAGGMGEVYLAQDENLERDVAIKLLPTEAFSNPTVQKRFRQEALLLSRLNHPHICTIFEVSEEAGQPYLVMEYIKGRPLSSIIKEKALLPEKAIHYGAQIASALSHAHQQGIIHRDLKGSNIMITPEGRVKILDFGIATKVIEHEAEKEQEEKLTKQGTVMGTPDYLAPELFEGKPADSRSDLWSLGVILYESVTGSLPFHRASTFETVGAIMHGSLSPLPETVPGGLRGVIQKCLEKAPEDRYHNADEVVAVLEALESGSYSTAIPAKPAEPTRLKPISISLAAIFLILLMLVVFDVGGLKSRFLGGVLSDQIRSIAVLPLEDLSKNPEQYFADGMTEQLITDLSKIGSLKVISRTSVMQYRGIKKPLKEIAKELGVQGIIEGSILRVGDKVRITTQLIHAATDEHLWAESYERDLKDVLSIQSEVAKTVAEQVHASISQQEQKLLASSREVDPEAYKLFLEGQFHANKLIEAGLFRGIEFFNQSIEKDSTFAPAYAGIAFAYINLSTNYRPPLEVMPEAKKAAQKAMELDNNLAEPHAIMSFINTMFEWDWKGAEEQAKQALALNPNSSFAHFSYGIYLTIMGEWEKAIAELKKARELDPLSLLYGLYLSIVQFSSGKYDSALETTNQMLKIDPNFAYAYAARGMIFGGKRDFTKSFQAYDKSCELEPTSAFKAYRSYGYALAGKREEALTMVSEVEKLYKTQYLCPYEIALTYVALDQVDQAFYWIDEAEKVRADCIPWSSIDPRVDPIRSDPRFQALMKRIGLEHNDRM